MEEIKVRKHEGKENMGKGMTTDQTNDRNRKG
jgi:hypothetical protein